MKTQFIFASLLGGFITMSSCKKEDPKIPNQEELITTLNYTLISQDLTDTIIFSFKDLDGPGGNDPVITNGLLKANTTYYGNIEVLNEQTLPAEDITEEVLDEDEEHQFFYVGSIDLKADITYADQDGDGNPTGIETELETGNISIGNLTVILRHEPDKFASGVSDGDITNAGGETDIEVIFSVDIQ